MLKKSAPHITGAAVASAMGNSLGTFAERLRARWVCEEKSASPGGPQTQASLEWGETGVSRQHRFREWTDKPLATLDLRDFGLAPAANCDEVLQRVLLETAYKLARQTAVFERHRPQDLGFFFGTSSAGVANLETKLRPLLQKPGVDLHQSILDHSGSSHNLRDDHPVHHGWISNIVTERLPIRGPLMIFSSSCSSGALAITEAMDAVASGIVPAAIAGGIDILSPLKIKGFDALQVLAQDRAKPFQDSSPGINLGEGGALILIERTAEKLERSRERAGHGPAHKNAAEDRVRSWGRLLSGAISSEAFHMTRPRPNGEGIAPTVNTALKDAHLDPKQVNYINGHGTGTRLNDDAEQKAVTEVFGHDNHLYSSKHLTGHTLAGAGALETVVTMLRLEALATAHSKVSETTATRTIGLNHSFGFGGTNVVLAMEGPQG